MTPGGSARFSQEATVASPDNVVRFFHAIAVIAAQSLVTYQPGDGSRRLVMGGVQFYWRTQLHQSRQPGDDC